MASNPGPYSEILGQGESKHYANEVFKTSNYGSFPTSAKYEWLWMVGEKEQLLGVLQMYNKKVEDGFDEFDVKWGEVPHPSREQLEELIMGELEF